MARTTHWQNAGKDQTIMMGNTDVALRVAYDVMRERHADAARDRRARESHAEHERAMFRIPRISLRLPKFDLASRLGMSRTETA